MQPAAVVVHPAAIHAAPGASFAQVWLQAAGWVHTGPNAHPGSAAHARAPNVEHACGVPSHPRLLLNVQPCAAQAPAL